MSSFCLRCLGVITVPGSGVCLEGLVSAELVSILNVIFLSELQTFGTLFKPPPNIVVSLCIRYSVQQAHHHHPHRQSEYIVHTFT